MIDIVVDGVRIGVLETRTRVGLTVIYEGFIARGVDLASRKALAIRLIDAETGRRIDMGFTHRGDTFSLSATAQRNLLGLQVNAALLIPVATGTSDDLGEITLNTVEEVQDFVLAALATVNVHRIGGRTVKRAVVAAADDAAVLAAVDAWLYAEPG